ncbi:MAG: GIY-YIG nuclease family protein [Rickettsiales bacterium]|nr:GIY-YIG nuclease family protein [Rickettsiales bacterium]
MQYYVYIMIDHPLGLPYIGMTNDLVRRVYEHKNHLAKGSYTDKYNQDKLVYYEIYDNPEQAILREKRLKKWNHNWKMRLIIDQNPHWKDLYEEILQ